MSLPHPLLTLPNITELNAYTFDAFNLVISLLFEPAPPLAQSLYSARPFLSYTSLIDFAQALTLGSELTPSEKLEVINAHSRLGETKQNLSVFSLKEQGYREFVQGKFGNINSERDYGLKEDEDLDVIINNKLQELNASYEEKYGFRFVLFVNGRARKDIIPILEARLKDGNRELEFINGLKAMFDIARDRLHKMEHV
ncbi:hypothetical protein G9A89_023311 [Geosiphon pyriformis]|nr:hypothetical protein G9A89_023311 [Geosiphon pyriformis]